MATEKALGEEQQKQRRDWARELRLPRGPGDWPGLQQGSLGPSPLAQGKERWGKRRAQWWPGMGQLPQKHLATQAGAAWRESPRSPGTISRAGM